MILDRLPWKIFSRRSRCFSACFFIALLLLSGWQPGRLLAADPIELPRYRPYFYPFDGGEHAEYQASWNGIPIASAEIDTAALFIDGKKFYQVKVRTRTWRYLELVWKMRDTIESIFEARTFSTYRFIFRQRENRRKINTTVHFDPASKKWAVHREQGNNVRDYEFISQHTMDPVSAIYLARSLDFKVGDTLRMDVFGGNSRYLVTMDVVGREQVTVKSGTLEAYKIIPRVTNLTASGYAGRVRQATVWISADDNRRPLKITSQVFIGYVNIELVGGKG